MAEYSNHKATVSSDQFHSPGKGKRFKPQSSADPNRRGSERQASGVLAILCHGVWQFDFRAKASLPTPRKKDWIKADVGSGAVTIMVVSLLIFLAGNLIARSYARSANPELDQDSAQNYSREARCKTKYLEPCRLSNPMNNDCGHNAIEYSWCMKGNER
jgi:hypothetical protein